MKRIIASMIFPICAAAALGELRTGTDVISVQTLSEAGIDLSGDDYVTYEYTAPATGTTYRLTCPADREGMLDLGMGMNFSNTDSPGYIKEIRFIGMEGGFTVYAGNEPISTSPFMQEGVVTLDVDAATCAVVPDTSYTYMGIWPFMGLASAIEIEWTDSPVAVGSISADTDAVRWYDLTGRELQQPAGGIMIRMSGGKTDKVTVR